MPDGDFWLEVIEGEVSGPRTVAFSHGQSVLLGRSSAANVCLSGPEVSVEHARIFFQGGTHFIQNLSDRGTIVGSALTRLGPLRDGDVIRMGKDVAIRFGAGTPPAAPQATASPAAPPSASPPGASPPPAGPVPGPRAPGTTPPPPGPAPGPAGPDTAPTRPSAPIGAAQPARVTITVVAGRRPAQGAAQFQKVAISIGAEESCDFVVDDPAVAPVHARLHIVGNLVVLEAIEGTEVQVNDRQIQTRTHLAAGDAIRLGKEGPVLRLDFLGLAPGARTAQAAEGVDEEEKPRGILDQWIYLAIPAWLAIVAIPFLPGSRAAAPSLELGLRYWSIEETIDLGLAAAADHFYDQKAFPSSGQTPYVKYGVHPRRKVPNVWYFDRERYMRERRTGRRSHNAARAVELSAAARELGSAPPLNRRALYDALVLANEGQALGPSPDRQRVVEEIETRLRKRLLGLFHEAAALQANREPQRALARWRDVIATAPDPANPVAVYARHQGLAIILAKE